jgi:hypothetical protein
MRVGFVIVLTASILRVSSALAVDFPDHHADICVERTISGKNVSIVSKEKLAKFLLKSDDAGSNLYIDVDTVNSKYAPKWRAIFVDTDFCATAPGCLAQPADDSAKGANPTAKDNSAALKTLKHLRSIFVESIQNATRNSGLYSTQDPEIGKRYLLGDDTENPIYCVGADPAPPPKPLVFKMPSGLRLRANSDDLNIDASKPAFKTVKPATINYMADGVQGTRVTKLQAALGYAIPLPFGDQAPRGFSEFDGEFVPFISTNEGITKSNGKLATLADTNSVAVGSLFNLSTMLDAVPGLVNVISAKPQYIWNTKDKSEIASLAFVYQPFSVTGLRVNVPSQIGTFAGASWLTLLFDVRSDVGDYTRNGVIPTLARAHTSFDRAGSRFGFALSTDDHGPHVVLNVTETLLYGFVGSIRRLDYLDSSLTFYFDSTSNFGFTLSYTKGTNEDTLQRAQIYMAGLSAKF